MNELEIPLVSDNRIWDCCDRQYRRCILNCLIYLKSVNILEIGTHTYGSTSAMSHYINRYQPTGKIITADISEWTRGEPPLNVYPVMVYPHSLDVKQRHGNIDIYHKNWEKQLSFGNNSIQLNGKLINYKMEELGIEAFDFVFVDGDHSRHAILSDLYIAMGLTHQDSYILIDDINDYNNEQRNFYHNSLKRNNQFYEFEDWNKYQNVPVGMGIIRAGDLKL